MLLAAAVKMIIELISMSIDMFNQKLILNYTNNVTENNCTIMVTDEYYGLDFSLLGKTTNQKTYDSSKSHGPDPW